MKKVIPFNKDITFNTNIEEIQSISLEQNLKVLNNEINGELIISGDYKDSLDNLNSEPFIYNLPINITLGDKYETNDIKIDIDNFNYEIVSNNILNVDVSILIEGLLEKNDIEETIPIIDMIEEEPVRTEPIEEEPVRTDPIEDNSINTIINNIDSDEKFTTYHVHIYREKDNINDLLLKYNISKEELEEYNDLSNITLGSKLIIPSND